jgi:hypothetical protein
VNHPTFVQFSENVGYPGRDRQGLNDLKLSLGENVQQRLATRVVQDYGGGAGMIDVLQGVQDSGASQGT